MSATIESLSTLTSTERSDSSPSKGLIQVSDTPNLEGQSMRSGSVRLARLSYLMTLGERVGIVDINEQGVKSLVVDTERYGKVRILDFSGTEQGKTHPYRVQRLWQDREDYYLNTKIVGEKGESYPKMLEFVQGGLHDPEISLGDLLDATDYLLCKLRRSGMSKRMARLAVANGRH